MKQNVIEVPFNKENENSAILFIYPADRPNGKVVIMCPGGGFKQVAMEHEGKAFATWFNEQGITYAILKYRMPKGHISYIEEDIRQALLYMCARKEEFHAERVGVMGASIGGYIAAMSATSFPPAERPDFQILLYPVISMLDEWTHLPSRGRLLGKEVTVEEQERLSLELRVDSAVPPTFMALASDDKAVSPMNSISYYIALLKEGVSSSLHIYPEGGHSFAFNDSFVYKKEWTEELKKWLEQVKCPDLCTPREDL